MVTAAKMTMLFLRRGGSSHVPSIPENVVSLRAWLE